MNIREQLRQLIIAVEGKKEALDEILASLRTQLDEGIKATILVPGDMSVGIPDSEIIVNFGKWAEGYKGFFASQEREELRKGLQDFGNTYMDSCGPCGVLFSDECPGCFKVESECRCPPEE